MSDAIILFGAGGHATVVLDALLLARPGVIVHILDDDPAAKGRTLLGLPVVGGRGWIAEHGGGLRVVPAIGTNVVRAELARWVVDGGGSLASVVHPGASVAASARIGAGAFVAAGAVINAQAEIGEAAVVNTRASVDHDCRVGFAAHIAPGATLCGAVEVGARTLIGAGATVIPCVRIGADALVGAGAVAVRNVEDGARVSGNPARPMGCAPRSP
jgi:sugar O-acyltransferase (sialic acid O-acetyltransferase NeuD family)